MTVLRLAQQITGAAQLQVFLRNDKPTAQIAGALRFQRTTGILYIR